MATSEFEKPRRFRRRGGAKKKKKEKSVQADGSDNDKAHKSDELTFQASVSDGYFLDYAPSSSVPETAPSDVKPGSTSEHPSVRPVSYSHATLDADVEAYLTKVKDEFDLLCNTEQTEEVYSNPDDVDPENPSPCTLLARNTMSELAPRLHELARNNLASRFLESLVPYAGAPVCVTLLDTLLEAGSRQFSSLATHPCASHLLQTLLVTAIPASVPQLLPEVLISWDHETLIQIISSSAGTHVFRSAVALLVAMPVNEPSAAAIMDNIPPSARYYDDLSRKPDEASKKAVIHITETILKGEDHLKTLVFASYSSAALQSLLTALAICSPADGFKLAEKVLSISDFDTLVSDKCASRFIDRALLTCGPSIIPSFSNDDMLLSYARHRTANFCVQRYITSLTRRGDVQRVARALEGAIGDHLLTFGSAREGVVLAILRAAEHFGDPQSRSLLARAVAKGVGAVGAEAKHLAGCLALRQQSVWREWCRRVDDVGVSGMIDTSNAYGNILRLPRGLPRPSLLGVLIARTMMRLPEGAGQSARDAMASISNVQLLALSADSVGSRLVEQWIVNPVAVKVEKVATKLVKVYMGDGSIDGFFAAVCRNPSCGMLVVRCLERVDADTRRTAMEALAGLVEELSKDRFGQVVIRKCRVRHFMRRNEQWEKQETARETKQRLFSDILDDDGKESSAKKGKKRKRVKSDSVQKHHKENKDNDTSESTTKPDDSNLSSVINAIEAAGKPKKEKKRKRKEKK